MPAKKRFKPGSTPKSKQLPSQMPARTHALHVEGHRGDFNLPEIILGGQDGLVNVLGVVLGMAAATASPKIVLVAGLAATFAESASMAAVVYTSRLAEADFYQSELEREEWEMENLPEEERKEIRDLYATYGFKGGVLNQIVKIITSDKKTWLKVMMEQELKLSPVERSDALPRAALVGTAAIIGSLIPLLPFLLLPVGPAIWASVTISAVTMFSIGVYKAKKTLGRNLLMQGLEMMAVSMLSALIGYGIGRLFKV